MATQGPSWWRWHWLGVSQLLPSQLAGATRTDACKFMRPGWAPPFGAMVRRSALDGPLIAAGHKKESPLRSANVHRCAVQ